jgi:anti-sigma factor RsiW
MNDVTRDPHLPPRDMERYVDGDLPADRLAGAEAHLAACSACRRETARYRALFADLDRLPVPEPPFGFDVRILDAVIRRPSEGAVLLRLAGRAYAVLAAVLVALATGIFLVEGSTPFENAFASAVSHAIDSGLEGIRLIGAGFFDLLKTTLHFVALADAAGALARGLEAAATSLAPQVVLVTVLTLSLATLVLVWALSPARERGVPHVSLSL